MVDGKMCVVVLQCCAFPGYTTCLIRLRLNVHLALRGTQALPRLTPTSGEQNMVKLKKYAALLRHKPHEAVGLPACKS